MQTFPNFAKLNVLPDMQGVLEEARISHKILGEKRFDVFASKLFPMVAQALPLMVFELDALIESLHPGGRDYSGCCFRVNLEKLNRLSQEAQDVAAKKAFTVTLEGLEHFARASTLSVPRLLHDLLKKSSSSTEAITLEVIELKVSNYYVKKGCEFDMGEPAKTFFELDKLLGRLPNEIKRIVIEPGVLSNNAYSTGYDGDTLIMQRVDPPDVPENILLHFKEKYSGSMYHKEIQRRLDSGQKVKAVLNRDSTLQKFVLNPGRYDGQAQISRAASLMRRQRLYGSFDLEIERACMALTEAFAANTVIFKECAHRRFTRAYNAYKMIRLKYWSDAKSCCYRDTIPKVIPALPQLDFLTPVIRRSATNGEKSALAGSGVKIKSYYKTLLAEMAHYTLAVGHAPDCAFELISPVNPSMLNPSFPFSYHGIYD